MLFHGEICGVDALSCSLQGGTFVCIVFDWNSRVLDLLRRSPIGQNLHGVQGVLSSHPSFLLSSPQNDVLAGRQ